MDERQKTMLDSLRKMIGGDQLVTGDTKITAFKMELDALVEAYEYGAKKHASADVRNIRETDNPAEVLAAVINYLKRQEADSLDDLDVLCLAGSVLVSFGLQGLAERVEGILCANVVEKANHGKKRLSKGGKRKLSEEDAKKACAAVDARMIKNKRLSLTQACKLECDRWGVSYKKLSDLMKS